MLLWCKQGKEWGLNLAPGPKRPWKDRWWDPPSPDGWLWTWLWTSIELFVYIMFIWRLSRDVVPHECFGIEGCISSWLLCRSLCSFSLFLLLVLCSHCKMCPFTTVYSSSGKQSVPRLIIPPFVVIVLADQSMGYCLFKKLRTISFEAEKLVSPN